MKIAFRFCEVDVILYKYGIFPGWCAIKTKKKRVSWFVSSKIIGYVK